MDPDRVLVGNLIGAKVVGPSGDVIGAVRDVVALPDARIAALVLAPRDLRQPIFVPWEAVTFSRDENGGHRATVPEGLDGLRASKAVIDLTDALGAMIPGTPRALEAEKTKGG